MLLSIDPGIHAGWAIFDPKTKGLEQCGLGLESLLHYGVDGLTKGVIEIPRIYPKSPVPPQDIATLAKTAGYLKGRLHPISFTEVFPRDWKGSVPKPVHNRRVLHALSTTDQYVFSVCVEGIADGLVNNVIDAVGLGVWFLTKSGLTT